MLVLFLAAIVILVMLVIKNSSKPKDYPPGPFCFPLIGNWHCVPGQGIQYKVPEWRKKYGNIIGFKMGFQNLVVITGYEEMITALKNDNFQNRHRSPHQIFKLFDNVGFFIADGEQYNKVRPFTVRFFTQLTAANVESVIDNEMMNRFSTIKSGEIAVVDGEFMQFVVNILFTFLIGDSIKSLRNELNTLRAVVSTSFKTGRISGIEYFYPFLGIIYRHKAQLVVFKYVENFFRDRIKEHRETFDPKNIRDYIDVFLSEQKKEREIGQTELLSDEEMLECLVDLGKSSTDSTSNTLQFILLYVVLNPRVQDKMHNELDSVLGNRFPSMKDKSSLPYCSAVITETLRINPTAATAAKHSPSEDTQFYGHTIPKGTMIVFPFWDMFRNPDEFDDPETFIPERFVSKKVKSKVIAFGVGQRSCVVESITKKILFLTVTYFFQKYSISLPPGYKYPDSEPLLGFTNSPKPFHIIITERQSK